MIRFAPSWMIAAILLCLGGASPAVAQDVQWGGVAELGWSWVYDSGQVDRIVAPPAIDDTRVRGTAAAALGVRAVVPLTDWLAAEPQVTINTTGVTFVRERPVFGFFTTTEEYTATYQGVYTTLTVPLAVSVPFGDIWTARLLAGPWLSMRAVSTWRRSDESGDVNTFSRNQPFETRRWNGGGRAGLGVSLDADFFVADGRIDLDFVVDSGLTDRIPGSPTIRTRTARLTLTCIVQDWGADATGR